MKHLTYLFVLLTGVMTWTSCSDSDLLPMGSGDAVELTDIAPRMSRATVAPLSDYVGKSQFANDDRIVFTAVHRTDRPIPQFNYKGLEYVCSSTTTDGGLTSIGWTRDTEKGNNLAGSSEEHPDRIYWSDATSPHTFIGYCTPQQGTGSSTFDWNMRTVSTLDTYFGSIGDPTESADTLFFDSTYDSVGKDTVSGNVELCKNDILLTHSNTVVAKDAVAELQFYHGLAQARVIVSISDFAAGGGDDTKSIVSNMVLKSMPTVYKWEGQSAKTEPVIAAEQTTLDDIYSESTVRYNQTRHFKLWIPNPRGVGLNANKTFTFYGLAVPTTVETTQTVDFEFKVTYPNPMEPTTNQTKTYSGSISGIRFDAGKCTTINIALNHRNEKMTVGAEYDEWDFVDTPDHGVLKKHSTFLDTADRDSVTIFGDTKATVDDATWLYVDATSKKILDVYGNDGSLESPFVISTARELLSFAYEVKGTRRPAVTYTNLKGSSVELAAGASFDFTDYNVRLDADITMQPSSKVLYDGSGFYTLGDNDSHDSTNGVTWIGIGETGKAFNGHFMGGSRHINSLYGKALFAQIGRNGIVEHVFITNALGITGRASVAEQNAGVICGFNIEGNIKVEDTTARYCGSIAGENTGVLLACSAIGDVEGYGTVGALVGYNDGVVAASYCVSDATTKSASGHAYAGVGVFTPRSIAYCCYFNKDKFTGVDYAELTAAGTIGHVAFPLSSAKMMSSGFVYTPYFIDPSTNLPTSGEIIDDSDKRPSPDDIFYSHFSLNVGLRRAIEYFFYAYSQAQDDKVYLHAPGQSYTNDPVHQVTLSKTIASWLIDHFGYKTGEEWDLLYEFRYIPATYPKLQ